MKNTYECPWCGNELPYSKRESIKCKYCGEIIKPAQKGHQAEAYYPTASLKIGKSIFGIVKK